MSFLAPLFLVGAAVVAAPIIFHLIRRTSKEKTIFSSLMFLQPTPPRLTRRSRLEHILLLALRCLVLCLLAFGFARPFLQRPFANSQNGQAKKMAILIDTSASMRREDLWQRARAKAEEYLRAATPADSVALFTFDRRLTPLISFEQWAELGLGQRASAAIDRLNQSSPGWRDTHLGNALISAVEALEESASREPQGTASRQLVLITDLQEGARLDGLQGYEWPRGMELTIETIKPKKTSNAGLQLVTEREEAEMTADPATKIRVSNSADSGREQFRVGWLPTADAAFVGPNLDVYVPPGQNTILQAPPIPNGLREQRLVLVGDEQDFDNAVFVVPPRAEKIPVLYLGDESERDPGQPLYYLRRAFQQTQIQSVNIVARTNNSMITPADLASAQLVVASESMNDDLLKVARQSLESGKTVVLPMRSTQDAQILGKLLGTSGVAAEEIGGNGYAMLEQIDFQSAIFSPFDDPRFNDFTKIHFWKHRKLDTNGLPSAKVLARFDKGDPAFIQIAVQKGTLLVLTSGWHPADSQLALSSKFVPMLYSLLQSSGSIKAHRSQYVVGDSVPITVAGSSISIQPPQGATIALNGANQFTDTALPGIYTVNGGEEPWRFAVNLAPEESKTAPIPVEELQRLGLPLKATVADQARKLEQERKLQNVELEARQKLWRWLILAALVVLMLETWAAGFLSRRASVQTGATV